MKIERLFIPGPAGVLEGLLEWEPKVTARHAALVCHPHPLYGGTMHNKVVFQAAKGAMVSGLPVLRFNFRGVGKSQGVYDAGEGERMDVRAALDYLESRFTGASLCVIGFSFGAWVGLRAGMEDARVCAMIGVGMPVSSVDFSYLRELHTPVAIVQGSQDQYAHPAKLQEVFDSIPAPKSLKWVEGVDHFFTGKVDQVQAAVREALGAWGLAVAQATDYRA